MLSLLAHAGAPLAPHDLATAWRADPLVVAGLVVAVALHHRGGQRRPDRGAAVAFHLALVAVAVALLSPVEAAAGVLLSAHMLQHDLLVLVAAPLLVLARPGPRLLRGLPGAARRGVGRTRRTLHLGARHARGLHHPAVGFAALVLALWTWHAAGLYGAALGSPVVHASEHVTLLVAGWLFWSAVAAAARSGRPATAVGLLFLAALQGVLLGMLLLFAPEPWYATYATTTAAWGLTPLTDQQLAGLLLWLPASVLYVGTAVTVVVRALRDDPTTGPAARTDPAALG